MRFIFKFSAVTLIALILVLPISSPVKAHLMAAQHGTLNIVGDGVFMVLSLPISAFDGMDDDNDGNISLIEFNLHRGATVDSIRRNVTLSEAQKTVALEGIMLSPVVPHDAIAPSISQLTVMGRFTLKDTANVLRFSVGLYGRKAAEQSLEITATHKRDKQKTVFELTPTAPTAAFFNRG